MRIVPLRIEHEQALAEFVQDFQAAGESEIPAYFAKPDWPHAEIVRSFEAWEKGHEIGTFVPTSTRFLEHEGRLLGVSNFRHKLNESLLTHGGNTGFSVRPSNRGKGYAGQLLAGAKEFGRGLGLSKILVTCSRDNPTSARVIERGGGVYEDEIYNDEYAGLVCRYWIDLA